MFCSIVILTKNQLSILKRSIPSLLNQKLNQKYEIIVLDSGSTDGAREYLEQYNDQIQIIDIPSKEFHYAKTFNKGCKFAKGEIIVRLSGDVIPLNESWLDELLKPFSAPKVGATYSKYTIDESKSGVRYPEFWPKNRFPEKDLVFDESPKSIFSTLHLGKFSQYTSLAGGCCAIRGEVLTQRPFNENIILGEDAEYAYFLHCIGYHIQYCHRSIVNHEHKQKKLWQYDVVKKPWKFMQWQVGMPFEILKYWIKVYLGRDPYSTLKEKVKAL